MQINFIVNQFYLLGADQAKIGTYLATFCFQVGDNAEEVPLDIHLGFASQGKSEQVHDPADVGEGRFNNSYPQAIQSAARTESIYTSFFR
ncbi:MAG: hypothetical protein KKB91_07645 [Proteobacteria bacterium]|jgi:hypothetical protein|nr:hypothetical protein [Desulfocapsa sp.]MBU3944966.1 hypothetical protein [Pseudomonadota bacterium]MCG2743579.1 hypothetical protein [Desulfobacteraceae bacterium]MBU3982143.1 hypothetical protein [Pseudomonadota bacterium]MBU4027676.1 hypothetical protein [Pseudomonadota bacterium]